MPRIWKAAAAALLDVITADYFLNERERFLQKWTRERTALCGGFFLDRTRKGPKVDKTSRATS